MTKAEQLLENTSRQSGQLLPAMQAHAQEFAEWCHINHFKYFKKWCRWFRNDLPYTTTELYHLFNNEI